MDLDKLISVADNASALRSKTELTPAGGAGDKVFPPTYAGAKYAEETRRIEGDSVPCILLDSVQSQANRFEYALQDALNRGLISIPVIVVDFPDEIALHVGQTTSLTVPHRCYDAIIRDSYDENNVKFPNSDIGELLRNASADNATSVYRYCPTALIYGAWDSSGNRGGMGTKFTRSLSSEIIGIGSAIGTRTSSRIDPLGIRSEIKITTPEKNKTDWELAPAATTKGVKKPSEVLHGNIAPSIDTNAGGVTVDRIEHSWTLSLAALRRYRFPIEGVYDDDRDIAGRAVLVSLALAARALARRDGLFLRSRCALVPASPVNTLQLVNVDGSIEDLEDLTLEDTLDLLSSAREWAESLGLVWRSEPLILRPQEKLIELVQLSLHMPPGSDSES